MWGRHGKRHRLKCMKHWGGTTFQLKIPFPYVGSVCKPLRGLGANAYTQLCETTTGKESFT